MLDSSRILKLIEVGCVTITFHVVVMSTKDYQVLLLACLHHLLVDVVGRMELGGTDNPHCDFGLLQFEEKGQLDCNIL